MSDLLLLPFEKANDALKRLSQMRIPYLHLCPFMYHGLTVTQWPEPGSVVVVTSARSFEFHSNTKYWSDRRLFVVGKGTESAAKSLGLEPEFIGHGGGASAVRAARKVTNGIIHHLGGQYLSQPLRGALSGIRHNRISLYGRKQNPLFEEAKNNIRLSAVSSPATAAAIGKHPTFSNAPCVCIGPTTQNAAIEAGLQVVGMAKEPSFQSLIQEAVNAYNRD